MTKSRSKTQQPNGKGKGWNKGNRALTDEVVDEMIKLYKEQHLSMADLAQRYYVATATVSRAFKRRRIKTRPAGPLGSLDVPTDLIVKMKEEEGLSYRTIGKKVMLGSTSVQHRYENYLAGKAQKVKK